MGAGDILPPRFTFGRSIHRANLMVTMAALYAQAAAALLADDTSHASALRMDNSAYRGKSMVDFAHGVGALVSSGAISWHSVDVCLRLLLLIDGECFIGYGPGNCGIRGIVSQIENNIMPRTGNWWPYTDDVAVQPSIFARAITARQFCAVIAGTSAMDPPGS